MLKEVKTGSVKDKLLPTVLGIGIVGDKYPTKVDGKHTKEYSIWRGLFKRCYDEKFHKNNITYVECEVVSKFVYYDKFFDWCQNQIGFGIDGFEIDKDLLVKGNKYYSEDFCVFLPKEINTALTKRGTTGEIMLLAFLTGKGTECFMLGLVRVSLAEQMLVGTKPN